MKGRIHSCQSLGTLDGPGVRFVLFLQGCPLRCAYCHNPDTWDISDGYEVEAEEIFQKLLRYSSYFGSTGGLTVSGGEALLQPDFVTELFSLCHMAEIHTCLDTSGCRLDENVRALLDITDLVLLDIKMTTDEDYHAYVGCPMKVPLQFLRELEERRLPTWLRQVMVPGLTDDEENLRRLAEISRAGCVEKVELLPFRKLCLEKYHSLGIPFPLENTPEPTMEAMRELERQFRKYRV